MLVIMKDVLRKRIASPCVLADNPLTRRGCTWNETVTSEASVMVLNKGRRSHPHRRNNQLWHTVLRCVSETPNEMLRRRGSTLPGPKLRENPGDKKKIEKKPREGGILGSLWLLPEWEKHFIHPSQLSSNTRMLIPLLVTTIVVSFLVSLYFLKAQVFLHQGASSIVVEKGTSLPQSFLTDSHKAVV